MKKFANKKINKFVNKPDFLSFKKEKELTLIFLNEIDNLYLFLSEQKNNINSKVDSNRIIRRLNRFFKKAEEYELSLHNRVIVNKIKKLFRECISNVINDSCLIKHGLSKPRGYPGDYKIIEAMYDNMPISKGIGYVLDLYFLNNFYVKAVRKRKNSMKLLLKDYIKSSERKNLNILNLACGSCRELRELFSCCSFKTTKTINFILVDKDFAALKFAKKELSGISGRITFNFIQADIFDFLRTPERYFYSFEKQDLIYSIGLADYLPSSLLWILINKSIIALSNRGSFILAHKNTKVFTSPISDWGADWQFIPRDEQDIEGLLKDNMLTKTIEYNFFTRQSKDIFYLQILKD